VQDSVLWLLDDVHAAGNLRSEAIRRGIDARRLVFTANLAQAEHLGRLQLADLALDTAPFNAHTIASDALWAGVPLVTCPRRDVLL
jgi:predicted O-linked N-acetylglucosamine transferase (SPINDLY family)